MTTQPVVIQRFTTSTGVIGWLLFRSGDFSRPLLALTDSEMTQLRRDIEWQTTRAAEKGQ